MLAPKRPTKTHLSSPVAASVRPSPAPQSSRPRPAAQTGPERPPTNHRPANHLVVRCAGAAPCHMSGWTGGSNPGPSCLPAALPRRLRLACWCRSATPSEPFCFQSANLQRHLQLVETGRSKLQTSQTTPRWWHEGLIPPLTSRFPMHRCVLWGGCLVELASLWLALAQRVVYDYMRC